MLLSVWEEFLQSIAHQKDENPIVYSALHQLKPVSLTEEKITLSCDSQGFQFFVSKRVPTIQRQLAGFLGKRIEVEVVVAKKKGKKQEQPLLQFQPSIQDVYKKAGLHGNYLFDNFAVSPTNQVAYAATKAVSDKPGRSYNPLFLWGGVGVGKTHLAQAVAHDLLEHDPSKKVLYAPGDLFTNELIEAIRGKSTESFRKKYRRLDLLIIDDVQFIAGKNTVQEEFFHTFNTIVTSQNRGQVILTADKPPQEIKGLEDRLRSRFMGGLSVDIQEPDFELRTAILLIKAQEKSIEIDIEAAKMIAEQVTDTRALEGSLLSIYARTLNGKNHIDLEEVEVYFQKKKERVFRRVGPHDVISVVCSYYNLKPSQLKGPYRSENIARPRQVAMYLLRTELKLKLSEIALILKRKDHTTVIHGINTIQGRAARDQLFKEELFRIAGSINPSTGQSL